MDLQIRPLVDKAFVLVEVLAPKLPAPLSAKIRPFIRLIFLKKRPRILIEPLNILASHIPGRFSVPVLHHSPVPVFFHRLRISDSAADIRKRQRQGQGGLPPAVLNIPSDLPDPVQKRKACIALFHPVRLLFFFCSSESVETLFWKTFRY